MIEELQSFRVGYFRIFIMNQPASLDTLYGPPISPHIIRAAERHGRFSNTFQLDPFAASYLLSVLDMAQRFPSFKDLALNICLLWAVSERGQIWITMEEVCLATELGKRFPRMRNMPLDSSLEALGHPLLVQGGRARIAGELILDEEGPQTYWVLSNKSGRYGFGPHREPAHLANVARAFLGVGVDVQTHYIRGR